MDIESIKNKIEFAENQLVTAKNRRDLSDSQMSRLVNHLHGYTNACKDMLIELENSLETAEWLKTICRKCKKEFDLDYQTVHMGNEKYAPHDNVAVIICPHCNKRTEY